MSAGVDFTNATTTFLVDDPANWPSPRFIIPGFSYDRFDQPRRAAPGPRGTMERAAPGSAGRLLTTPGPKSKRPVCSGSTDTRAEQRRS
jgi:hypothetical protein